MRSLKLFLLAWLAVFIQSSLSGLLSVWGLLPDFIAMIIGLTALTLGTGPGIQIGVMAGFMADCYHPSTLGLFTLSGAVSGYWAGSIRERIYKDQLANQLLIVALLSLVRQLFEYWGRGGGGLGGYISVLMRFGLGSAVYTALLGLLLLPHLKRFLPRTEKSKLRLA
ncbi:rod shape-determining protein MreD [candidate division TA06 bacterium]|uniref:Rod shape-determining protein MreD n=1 Tax=candidate division TA06 bacterium TaxID=2250710 RepID=A0A933IAK5_UNCT6|nr:rod shape-determining protein MreD [candidate division TA06 bacterium]